MPAIDTIAGSITGVQAALTAVTMAPNNSNVVRNFAPTDYAELLEAGYQAATTGSLQVKSVLMHDDTRGIQLTPTESPLKRGLPRQGRQRLKPQDSLAISLSGGAAAEVDVVTLSIFYSNLPGATARLKMWGDIAGLIANIKPVEVDFAQPAAGGQWSDTIITATESLLKANTDYAVLGYITNQACAAVGLYGSDTGNLRVTGPGSTDSLATSEYFVQLSNDTGLPTIPVINAANANNTFVSVVQGTALTAGKLQLILAQLSTNVGS